MGTALEGDRFVIPQMKLEKMLSMKGGYGESSYVKNSQAQARHARLMLHFLEASLDQTHLPTNSSLPFTVADLGCSCGTNTLSTVDFIITHISKRYATATAKPPPEFHAFFVDLPSNDFNMLFQQHCTRTTSIGRPYFAAGVPGSFYRRLFPAESVNFFHSAFSLHWLSRVPDEVVDVKSRAYNQGRVFVHGASDSTAQAYKKQFQSDLASFLKCRAREMRKGGSMFLVCLGRTSVNPADQGGVALLFSSHFEDAWDDLVREGLIQCEQRDKFNIPIYAPSLEEFKEVVAANGSFAITKLELVRGGSPLVLNRPDDAEEVGRALANSCQSVCGVLVDAYIGDQLSSELFLRLDRRATSHARELVDHLEFFHIAASLSFNL